MPDWLIDYGKFVVCWITCCCPSCGHHKNAFNIDSYNGNVLTNYYYHLSFFFCFSCISLPRGGVTVPSNFWDSFLFMCTPFDTELPKFHMVTAGEGVWYRYLGLGLVYLYHRVWYRYRQRPHPKGGAQTLYNFGSSLIYTRTHIVTELPNLTL